MPKEPEIKMMSYQSRTRFFKVLFLIFILTLPIFIFYTTGYRISFEEEGATVVTTGGLYITTDELDVEVYLDEVQVERPRLFRSAYYIQNIAAGQHRVVVQGEGLQTWVKELPVDPYIVSEAAAFNMPEQPLIRPISEFLTATGTPVYFATSTTAAFFVGTSTVPYVVATNTATSTLTENSEFEFVMSLFATSTATNSPTLLERLGEGVEFLQPGTSTEATAATNSDAVLPNDFVQRGNMRLVERGKELFAVWTGDVNSVPHYFCVNNVASSTIAERFGEHVAEQIEAQRLSTTTPLIVDGSRVCRTEIRLDRKWQEVEYYAFFPGSSDLVIMQLQDGLYVTEIDDRAWQNTQQVYPGDSFSTIVTDDSIYIKDDGRLIELLTELVS